MAGVAMSRIRGAAVVLAMLLAALAAAVAATLFADQQRWLRTVEHRRDQVQAQALAMAGVLWASQIVDEDARRSAIDHLGEPWALTLPPYHWKTAKFAARSAMRKAAQHQRARRDRGSANVERARLEDSCCAQVRAAGRARRDGRLDRRRRRGGEASGGEDAVYLAQSVPRLAANAPVLRVAELGAVKGVTPRMMAALLPYLSALPAGTPVNVNTAPREVLAAIVEKPATRASRRFWPTVPASPSPPLPIPGATARWLRAGEDSRCRSRATTST